MNKFIIPFFLITAFLAVGCSDDEPKDVVNEIKMSVSAETGTYIPWGSDTPVECMLVMSEDNPGVWEPLGFNSIKWFTYERGHEYTFRWREPFSPILPWMLQTVPIRC